MTDSIKFGPEWLRNLSGDSCNSGGGGGGGGTANLITPRYQLAEHRYGREEMLGIFDRSCKPPETLISLQTLYVEKTQLPLAMLPMTEDETRAWSIGVGSSVIRGRGGSVDRGGRGRTGRGGTYTSHYSRSVGFDDSGDGSRLESQPYTSRNRGFDRSQSERGWTDRNGVTDQGDWNGISTSPRKEVSRGTSGSSLMESNWRRQRGGIGGGGGGGGGSGNIISSLDDDEGWRAAGNRSSNEKWSRGSWRDASGNERDRLDRSDGDIDENRPPGRWDRPTHRQSHDPAIHHHTSSTGPPRTSRTWDSNHHDNLPEWATENPSESGGSFDASGAFHGGMFSDEDEEGGGRGNTSNEMRIRRVSEGNNNNGNHKIGKVIYQSPVGNNRQQNLSTTTTTTKERPKSLHPFDDKEPSIITSPDKPSISPTKQITSTNNNNSVKDNNNTRSTVQNSNEPPKIQGPQRSKSFIDPPTKTLKQNNDVRSKQNDQSSCTTSSTISSSTTTPTPTPTPTTTTTATATTTSRLSSLNQKAQILKQLQDVKTVQEIEQKQNDDDDERMKEEANMLVAKLMADEENHKEERLMHAQPVVNPVPPTQIVNSNVQEKWFYRDPQGELQGPFLANEMAEWCKAGYFTSSLQIRRECDDRFSTLGDLVKIFGRVPFTPGPTIPPLKIVETIIPTIPIPVPIPNPTTTTNISNNALPKPPPIDDPIALFQYSQLRLYHDQMIMQQVKNSAIAKLSQHEQWNNLNQVEKNHLIMQYVMQNPEIREMTANTNQYVPIIQPPQQQQQQQQQQPLPLPTNPIMQLFSQIQSGKTSNDNHLSQNTVPHIAPIHPVGNSIDPIQQLMQQMQQRGGIPNIPGPSQPNVIPQPQPQPQPQLQQNDDPIKSLLRQLHGDAAINGHQQIDSIWPHPPQQINPQFDGSSLLAQMRPLPSAAPPGQMPNMLWDLHTKGMKTEQQILEEQQQQQQQLLRQQQEDRTKEEQRKQEELLRKAKDESLKRQNEEEQKQQQQQQQQLQQKQQQRVRQLEELKRKEEQKKIKEEEKLRKEEEKRRIEEKIRKDEERKREEKRKIDEDNNRKKQEEEKKRRDELKKQEEKIKKEEEKKRKLEEEQKKIEEERLKKEEENRKKIEQEENARKAEQRRREADALKKLQEKSKAPWAPQAASVVTQSAASLTEIQRLEREMKAEEQRYQQMLQQQMNQQKAAQAAKEAAAAAAIDSSKKLQFKWAAKASSNAKPQVKSLDQIQQEEQERIAKSKQQEKEKAEKSNIKENTVVMQSVGIWGAASQSLNWTSSTATTTTTTILSSSSSSSLSSSNTVDNTKNTNVNKGAWAGSGFWDEPTPNKTANSIIKQTPVKTQVVAKSSNSTLQNQNLNNNNNNSNNNNNNNNNNNSNNNHNKIVKTKTKKEDEIVKKYDNNTNSKDEFGQWCYRTLCGLQSTVDIPTFVGFIKEIESAYEVKEYVKMYLGESKQTTEFVKQFLEKRSKLRSAQRPQAEADDLCKPAPAVNPNAPTEFQEVKGKSKKPKKGKMFKVDNTILGFSVTAATDRINVGDRDYGEGV